MQVLVMITPSRKGVGLQGELEAHSLLSREVMIWPGLTRDCERLSEPGSRNATQNQLRSGSALFDIRKAFIPSEGYTMAVADYDQLEMYIAAHRSGDEGLIAAARSGRDIHTANVELVYGEPYEDVVAAKRRKGTEEFTERDAYLLELRNAVKSVGFGQPKQAEVKLAQNVMGNLSAAA